MGKIKRPDLAAIKGIPLVARGRFQMKRALVEQIASELGEGYLRLHESPEKRHQYTLGAGSFVEVDEQFAMHESIEIAHCERGFVHFRYEESNGPKKAENGTPLVSGYDDDVGKILDALSCVGSKSLQLTYSIRPGGAPPIPSALTAGLGRISIAGLKVLIGHKRKGRDSVTLDWEDLEQVKATMQMTRALPITAEWPVILVKYTRDILEPLVEAGLSNAEHAKK